MATIKILLKENKKKVNGETPLYLRLTKDRRAKFISLGYSIRNIDWNARLCKVKKSHPNATWLNHFITQKMAEAEKLTLNLETDGNTITTGMIKQKLLGKSSDSFIKYAEKKIDELELAGKVRTQVRYKAVISKLKIYVNNSDMLFDEITVSFLKAYEAYLQSLGNRVNTIHSNLKTIRAILYSAIQEDLFPQEKNPFFKFKLKTEKTTKTKLSLAEIKKLIDLKLEKQTPLWHCRNYFLFSFYCAGIRIGDLIQLKWENIQNGRIVYKMDKTLTGKSLILISQANEILKYYKPDHPAAEKYIFPILSNDIDSKKKNILYQQISAKTALINKYLRDLAKLAEIEQPISSHVARHSYSDLARRKGMSLYNLSKTLGHSSLKITENYLADFDDESMDKDLEKVFDE